MMAWLRYLQALCLIALSSACNNEHTRAPQAPQTIRVLAASSLSDVVTELAHRFERRTFVHVEVSFDATSRLANQIEAGAVADVFMAADDVWMNTLREHNHVSPPAIHDWVGNELVMVVPSSDLASISSLSALTEERFHHIALSLGSVPAGRYAERSLAHEGLLEPVTSRIVRAPNVRATLAYVADGNAQAAFVYATDARVERRVRVAYHVPSAMHPPIVYQIATLAHAPNARLAAAFVADCLNEESISTLVQHGFKRLAPDAHAH